MLTINDQRTALKLRRDYIPETAGIPAMRVGDAALSADIIGQAKGFFENGVRHVEIGGVIDFTAAGAGGHLVAALVLIRELTAYGLVVAWRARLPEGVELPLLLGHLHPPEHVTGVSYGTEIAALWQRRFYVGKCFWRRGPGFIEVRDRRMPRTTRLTIDDAEHLAWIDALSRGVAKAAVPGKVLADFTAMHLVHEVGDSVWLIPYQIRRWPSRPLAV